MTAHECSSTEASLVRRGIEAAIWGMPAVNFELMYRELATKLNGGYNQIVYWSQLLDWKNQTLTPNPDVIYLMPFFDTGDVGPVVLEIPPADGGILNGSVTNMPRAGRSSQTPGLVHNDDGSVDIHFGPEPSATESNWIPTDPDGEFEVLARFYGPQSALFDTSWRLGDIDFV